MQGLRLGADDYISKPFSPRQLVARAQAVLRRAGKGTLADRRQVGSIVLDTSRRELRIGQGAAVTLTPLESRLLDYLLLNPGHVLTTDAIIGHVWGAEGGERDMLRQLVRRLRAKMSEAAAGHRSRCVHRDGGRPRLWPRDPLPQELAQPGASSAGPYCHSFVTGQSRHLSFASGIFLSTKSHTGEE